MRSQIQVLASGKPNNKLESRERICSKEDMEPEKVKEEIDKGEKRRSLAEAVWAVVAEATKLSVDEQALEKILPQCAFSNAIITAYKVYKDRLRDQLSTVGWEYPRVIDMDWKVCNVLEVITFSVSITLIDASSRHPL
uniref:Terpene_synth_C domain-containing protein n=1 Tax=Ascaris lumbricoides TaxID=6252 RepID=A0A0M3IGY8_ASCLU